MNPLVTKPEFGSVRAAQSIFLMFFVLGFRTSGHVARYDPVLSIFVLAHGLAGPYVMDLVAWARSPRSYDWIVFAVGGSIV
jgi:hypothetical protein